MEIPLNTKISVLGAGSFGTALAIHLGRNNYPVVLWGRAEDDTAQINKKRENLIYLPGIRLPDTVEVTDSLSTALAATSAVLIVTPSIAFRQTIKKIKLQDIEPEIGICWATKGLEQDSNKLLHQVVAEEFGADKKAAMISGPTFAREIAEGLPTAMTVASYNEKFAIFWSRLFTASNFRCYTSDDIIGAEIAAACKNIIAIAAGISDGLGFGSNARSAIITRGLHEIVLLGEALGAKTLTFMGLTGFGDLTLTCTDDKSRNRRLGLKLAAGMGVDEAKKEIGQSVEGVHAAKVIHELAREKNVEMPISYEIYKIIIGEYPPQTAVENLFRRELKPEL